MILATGLALGVVYGLVGVAVTSVTLATRALHLAIGPLVVVGVIVGLVGAGLGLPPVGALVAALVVSAVVSTALEPLVLSPLARRGGEGDDEEVMRWLIGLAIAAAVIDQATVRWLTTREYRPAALLGAVDVDPLPAAVAIGSIGLVSASWLVGCTRLGRQLRIVGGSRRAAALAGIGTARTRAAGLALSGALAGLAGVLIAPLTPLGTAQSQGLTVRGVAAAVLFGVGGPARAVAAGLTIGMVEAASAWVAPQLPRDVGVGVLVVGVLCIRGGELRRAWGRAW